VSDLDDAFRVIDNDGMEDGSLLFLEGNSEKCEIILQWIQRLTMDMTRSGVVVAPPPIVSRVFQELSRGIVNLNNARKIADIPFPFPYAQMASVMLGMHLIVAPIVAASLMNSLGWAVVLTFFPIYAFWGLNYIAAEIEAPFGDDPNDLPLVAMMNDMNTSLWMLLDKRTQLPPQFCFEARHTEFKSTIYSNMKKSYMARVIPPAAGPELEPGRRSLKPVTKPRRSSQVIANSNPGVTWNPLVSAFTPDKVGHTRLFNSSSSARSTASERLSAQKMPPPDFLTANSDVDGPCIDKGVQENGDQQSLVVAETLVIADPPVQVVEVAFIPPEASDFGEDTDSDAQRLRCASSPRPLGPRTDPNGRLPRREAPASREHSPTREHTDLLSVGGADDRPAQLPSPPQVNGKFQQFQDL